MEQPVKQHSSYAHDVENMVGVADLDREIDVNALAEDIPIKKQGKGTFSGGVFNPDEANASVLVFGSGKLTIVGGKSRGDIEETAGLFFDALRDLNDFEFTGEFDVSVRNMVCTAEFEFDASLATIAVGLGFETVEYEPEQFNALVYSPGDSSSVGESVTFLVFHTGSVVVTGARTHDEVEAALDRLCEELRECGVSCTPTAT